MEHARSSGPRENIAGAWGLILDVFPVWSANKILLENVAENPIQFKNDLRKV
jgi:hypothetical protein